MASAAFHMTSAHHEFVAGAILNETWFRNVIRLRRLCVPIAPNAGKVAFSDLQV